MLHAVGLLTFPVLLLMVAVAGALRGPGDAAKDGADPRRRGERAEVPMERATGLYVGGRAKRRAWWASRCAGALVVAGRSGHALAVDAVSASCVCRRGPRLDHRRPAAPRRTTVDGAPEERARRMRRARRASRASCARAGTFLRRDPVLIGLTLMIAVTNLLDLAWAERDGAGLGARVRTRRRPARRDLRGVRRGVRCVGALVAAAWGERIPRFRTYLIAFLLTGLPRFVVMAIDVPLWVVVAVFVVGGFASGFLNPILGAVFFERIPDAAGRAGQLAVDLGLLRPDAARRAARRRAHRRLRPVAGVRCVVGVAYFAATMAPAVLPSFREMDRRPVPPTTSRAPEPAP